MTSFQRHILALAWDMLSSLDETSVRKHLNPFTKLALELGPLVVFFTMNSRAGLFTATAWFMAAMVISMAVMWMLVRRLPIMPLVSCVLVLVFGGLTLVLQDELFIKLKPTIVNLMFSGALLAGLAMRKNLLDIVFDGVFNLTPEGWRLFTLRWAGFFFALAILNEIVWRGFSTDTWVAFKVWGVMPITVLFAMAQVPFITKHTVATDAPSPT
jgi:intracellular septation protein